MLLAGSQHYRRWHMRTQKLERIITIMHAGGRSRDSTARYRLAGFRTVLRGTGATPSPTRDGRRGSGVRGELTDAAAGRRAARYYVAV
eukprot:4025918-Prymnesium_polylepis.2